MVHLGLQELHTAIFAHQAHEEEKRLIPEVTRHWRFLYPLGVHVPMDASLLHIDHHLQHIPTLLEVRKSLIVPLPVQTDITLPVGKTAPEGDATGLVYISTHTLIPSLLCCEPNSHFIIPCAVAVDHNRNTPYT